MTIITIPSDTAAATRRAIEIELRYYEQFEPAWAGVRFRIEPNIDAECISIDDDDCDKLAGAELVQRLNDIA